MPFVDEAILKVKAGHGGDGCMSFRREKYIPKGGPDGGDGGRGGDIVLLGDENATDLSPYIYDPEWNAPHGQNGMGAQRAGKDGKDLFLKVPMGTQVIDTLSGKLVAELLTHNQQVRLLKGGRGGLGNIHFKSSVNRAPRQTTSGKPGQEGVFRLELKCIADIGLVGFPNAGKSSLINRLTHAQSKVAAYPFTTLNPQLGRMLKTDVEGHKIVIADIPGLIEGAHANRGLGHKFLKHLFRCKLLLFVIDVSGFEGRKPLADFKTLLVELEAYDPEFLNKPRLIVANKIDLIVKKAPSIKFVFNKKAQETIKVSCATGDGIDKLQKRLTEILA